MHVALRDCKTNPGLGFPFRSGGESVDVPVHVGAVGQGWRWGDGTQVLSVVEGAGQGVMCDLIVGLDDDQARRVVPGGSTT